MPDELKPVLARQMEVYAGFLEHTDHHVGRLIDAHRGPRGPRRHDRLLHHRRQRRLRRGHHERRLQRDGQLQRDGRAGDARVHAAARWTSSARPSSYNHYSVGWAWAMDTPFQWTKQVASHWGGTRNGTIVHWPQRDRGARRAALAVHPRDRRGAHDPRGGRAARADHGQRRAAVAHGGHEHAVHLQRAATRRSATTCSTSRCSATAASTTRAGARSPSTAPRGSWSAATLPAFDDDVWELYDGSSDYSQARDLAAEHPEMLAKLQRLWLIEATKYNVLPMDDRTAERLDPDMAGPADADPRELPAVLPRHGTPVGEQRGQHQEQVVLGHRRGRRPRRRRRGRDHRPGRPVRRLGRLRQGRQGQVRLQRARHPGVRHRGRRSRSRPAPTRCAWSSPTTAAGWPRAATSPSTTTATPVGTGRVEATQPMIFSADETTDIGYESGTTVTPDYTAADQPVHRQDQLGADRPRRRRPRPLHRPRGTPPHRHGPAVEVADTLSASHSSREQSPWE